MKQFCLSLYFAESTVSSACLIQTSLWLTEQSLQYIQGDSGGICNTLGNDSMFDSKQKCSYEHGSDFERLPIYGKKKIRTILRARSAIT